jgi:hypothetical protein
MDELTATFARLHLSRRIRDFLPLLIGHTMPMIDSPMRNKRRENGRK